MKTEKDVLVRCSELHRIMSSSRIKSRPLSESAMSYVEEVVIRHKYHRSKDVINRYISKGLQVEEDSITLFSLARKQFFVKNEKVLTNDYISGTPDLFVMKDKMIEEVIDVKSSWDIWTFMRARRELSDQYYWQGMGYMWLTGARKATVAYCLVDTPEVLINDEKRRLMWKMGAISDEDELYQQAAAELEKNLRYSDIDPQKRVHTWTVEYNEEDVKMIVEKVELCREYFKKLMNEI